MFEKRVGAWGRAEAAARAAEQLAQAGITNASPSERGDLWARATAEETAAQTREPQTGSGSHHHTHGSSDARQALRSARYPPSVP